MDQTLHLLCSARLLHSRHRHSRVHCSFRSSQGRQQMTVCEIVEGGSCRLVRVWSGAAIEVAVVRWNVERVNCAPAEVSLQALSGARSSMHTLVTPTLLARLPPRVALGPLGGALDLPFLPKISCANFSAARFRRPGVALAIPHSVVVKLSKPS